MSLDIFLMCVREAVFDAGNLPSENSRRLFNHTASWACDSTVTIGSPIFVGTMPKKDFEGWWEVFLRAVLVGTCGTQRLAMFPINQVPRAYIAVSMEANRQYSAWVVVCNNAARLPVLEGLARGPITVEPEVYDYWGEWRHKTN